MYETLYILGEVGIMSFLVYHLYLGVRNKYFSIIPVILGLVAWFLSSLIYYEITSEIGRLSTAYRNVTADVVGSMAILIGMNNYILMFNVLLTVVYVAVYIIHKTLEGTKKWKSK